MPTRIAAAAAAAAGAQALAPSLSTRQLQGTYVARLAVPGPYFAAEVKLKANGTYQVRVANIEEGPSPAMAGTWSSTGAQLVGSHTAPGFGAVTLTLDLTGASVKTLKSAKGVRGTVNLGGGQILPVTVRKTDKPFFA